MCDETGRDKLHVPHYQVPLRTGHSPLYHSIRVVRRLQFMPARSLATVAVNPVSSSLSRCLRATRLSLLPRRRGDASDAKAKEAAAALVRSPLPLAIPTGDVIVTVAAVRLRRGADEAAEEAAAEYEEEHDEEAHAVRRLRRGEMPSLTTAHVDVATVDQRAAT